LNWIRIVVRIECGIIDFSGRRDWLAFSRFLFLFEFHEIVRLGFDLSVYWFLWCFIFLATLLFFDDLPVQWSWGEILYNTSFYLRIETAAKALEKIYHPLFQITIVIYWRVSIPVDLLLIKWKDKSSILIQNQIIASTYDTWS
jgi:hypothetical protein